MNNKIPLPTITLAYYPKADYGIYYRMPLIGLFQDTGLTMREFIKLDCLLHSETNYNEVLPGKSTFEPNEKEATAITEKLFGYSLIQTYYRMMARQHLWARNRWGLGNWVLSKDIFWDDYLPRTSYGRRSNVFSRIPKHYLWLFQAMLDDCSEYTKAHDGNDRGYQWDYSQYDLGKDRKPPVWECNLCRHFDIREGWRWLSVACNWYIAECPKCKVDGASPLDEAFGQGSDFKPFKRMQDKLWFTMDIPPLVFETEDDTSDYEPPF